MTIIQKVEKLYLTIYYRRKEAILLSMRGVNRLVLEVRPENEYFEKALLFLKPDSNDLPQNKISGNAEKLLNDIKAGNNTRKREKGEPIVLLLAGIAAGSSLSWLLFLFTGLIN